jgi:DNA-directed RNA polymerase specialized sigma24 family protein
LDAEPDRPAGGLGVEDALVVRQCVAELPERQRVAIVLRYVADLSVRDTARVMRCPEGTVKTLTFEAIRMLRAHDALEALTLDEDGDVL